MMGGGAYFNNSAPQRSQLSYLTRLITRFLEDKSITPKFSVQLLSPTTDAAMEEILFLGCHRCSHV